MRAFLGLGSNLGDPEQNLLRAVQSIERTPWIEVAALSSAYQTEPVGPPQPDFLNAVVALETERTPGEVLMTALGIEAALGRERGVRWGPRVIDLDLLLAGEVVFEEPHLTLPHPRLIERAFVLAPLLELEPDLRDPRSDEPLRLALERLGLDGVGPATPLPRQIPRRDLDHTADLGFTVEAATEAEVLEAAALTLVDLMTDRTRVVERERQVVEVQGDDRVELLVALLGELVFLLDARDLVPRRVSLLRHEPGRATMAVFGEPFRDEDQLEAHVKAVTYHNAEVKRDPKRDRWSATVVVDL